METPLKTCIILDQLGVFETSQLLKLIEITLFQQDCMAVVENTYSRTIETCQLLETSQTDQNEHVVDQNRES